MIICAIILYLVPYLCTIINADVGVPTGRIFHGTEVTNCETYPWHAQLYYNEKICGGTLISENFVITSAHCTNECKVGSDYIIHLGSTKYRGGTQFYGKLKACLGNSISYDVALVELTTSVPSSLCMDYIPILDVKDSIEDGLPVTAIGFGDTEIIKLPNSLHESTSLMTMAQQLCEEEIIRTNGGLIAPMCTISQLDNGQIICGGDSGGSLFFKQDGYKPVLLGVISRGQSQDCNLGRIVAYAKVNDPVIFHWIQNITGNGVDFIRIGTRF